MILIYIYIYIYIYIERERGDKYIYIYIYIYIGDKYTYETMSGDSPFAYWTGYYFILSF